MEEPYSPRRSCLAGIDHDQELHEMVVDACTSCLDNEDILVTNRLPNRDGGLLIRVLEHDHFAESDSDSARQCQYAVNEDQRAVA